MAAAGAIIGIVGGVVQGVGSMMSANAAADTKKSYAAAENYNATVAELNAPIVQQQAANQEILSRTKAKAMEGEAIAGAGGGGTDLSGSNLDMLRQNRVSSEMDALNIRYAGQREAQGLMSQAYLDKYKSKNDLVSMDESSTAGAWGMASGLLSGASAYVGSEYNRNT